ncbi:hypothetical protein [Peribacillus frigoritolerans]|uniref:hypothetical protein n=1 Tax=Peribacillus frigoritolerans TaxID=450367 RepID=UPI002E1AED31|nr:hypothetical protein [Peribacillus frigoritolerans]
MQSKDSNKRNTMQPMSDTEENLDISGVSFNFMELVQKEKILKNSSQLTRKWQGKAL